MHLYSYASTKQEIISTGEPECVTYVLNNVIRINFQNLRRKKAWQENRDLPLRTIARESNLSLATIQRLNADTVAGLRIETIDALCAYFACGIGDLLEYVPDMRALEELADQDSSS